MSIIQGLRHVTCTLPNKQSLRPCAWQLLACRHRALTRFAVAPGNGGCTMITFPMASQLGLVDSAGRPIGVSRPRFISVRAVFVASDAQSDRCLVLVFPADC